MRRQANLWYGIALLFEAIAFHRAVLFYPGYLFPWDFRAVHIPFATFAADSFRRGEFPLWDPYTYCGTPIFANIQAALFYPPVLLATMAGAFVGNDALPRLLAIALIAQIVFAGICTYFLAKRLGASPASAWIAGTVYELGCFFAAQAEHMGMMHAATWLPLCWWCVVELRDGLKRRWLGILALALAMTTLAGSPPCAAAAFASTFALSVIIAAFRLARWKLPVSVIAASIWALLIAAIQILPTAQLTENSVAKYRTDWLKTGGGMNPGALFSLVIPNYWSVFDPAKFHGPGDLTFFYLYSSLLGLALAITAIIWKPARWTQVCGLLTLVAAIAMLGDTTLIGRTILAALPATIRIAIHPEYTYFNFSLGLALLAGLGASRVLKNERLRIAAGIVIACDLLLVSSDRPMNRVSTAIEPGIEQSELLPPLRALTGKTTPPSRFDMAPDVPYLWSSVAPQIAIPTANGCDPLAPERIVQVRLAFAPGARWGACYQVLNPASRILGLANVRYLIARGQINGNPNVLPRFFFVSRVRSVDNLQQAAAILHSPDFNPSEEAIVESREPGPQAHGSGSVEVVNYSATNVKLRVHASTASFLLAADTYYPGWEARIGGKPVELYIADVAFRGIRTPAGDHDVEMRFRPLILYRSAVISGLSLAAALLAIAGQSMRGRQIPLPHRA
jgi:hypothetical protein